LRCFNRIVRNACGIFLRFSKGSAEVWIGGSRFRHGILRRGMVLEQIRFEQVIPFPFIETRNPSGVTGLIIHGE
jgi:hypothetical protein